MRMNFLGALTMCGALLLTAPIAEAQSQAAAAAAAMPSKTAVNLNAATLDQLETLPGIGRKTAERIIEFRTKSGGFKRIEELMNVRGIGEKSFLKIKPLIVVTAKTDKAPGD
ncbi:MAG: helix-hairpin-helix domain-containing protein [Acidimicrobiia bacterium]|nr:helix-hairpin-helix domain-containing protein [Acidimicrobiia bacterium]